MVPPCLTYYFGMGYNMQGKQKIARFIRAECFPREVSALIMLKRIARV